EQPGNKEAAADQQQPPRSQPVDEIADQWRADAADQLRHRIGDRGLGAAPAEIGDKGDEIDRVGMHQRGAQRERAKRATEHDPGGPDSAPLDRVPDRHSGAPRSGESGTHEHLFLPAVSTDEPDISPSVFMASGPGLRPSRNDERRRRAKSYPRAAGRNRRRAPMSPRSRGSRRAV